MANAMANAMNMSDRLAPPAPTSQIIGALEETNQTERELHLLVHTLAERLQQIRRTGPEKMNKVAEVTPIGQSEVAQRITSIRSGMHASIALVSQVLEELEI